MIAKYTIEDARKQKFMVGNLDRWRMEDNKDIKVQINEYLKLNEALKAESIFLPENVLTRLLVETLPESWKEYKSHLKHKHKQLSLANLITHIIIEYANWKELQVTKAREMAAKANSCRKRVRNDNFPKPNANLVEGDDIIVAVFSEAYLVANVKEWVVDSGDGKEHVYLGGSRTAQVLGKGEVILKLTFGKTLDLNDVLKQKSDSLVAFIQFKNLVENQFERKIKQLRTDWGDEFQSFTQLVNEHSKTMLKINLRGKLSS
ncbi:uncharacterized protein LOC133034495 [Cannabis sativa]|uniref:uncharacterized protein LOC133034495 n=1 Tax=Cannabis sativa TaxID=3483 RepID=UPI0029CA84ED|nr:uncharacterized protein LOC133034495 [Cannabis sativa]